MPNLVGLLSERIRRVARREIGTQTQKTRRLGKREASKRLEMVRGR